MDSQELETFLELSSTDFLFIKKSIEKLRIVIQSIKIQNDLFLYDFLWNS